ncbi:WD repeat-containing protein 91 [Toxorhynchites rutilus septentrionalis]|uniref:WD repeat-containing protein 91 n=1 Tax=Toxorhynchites rutilus septentrionalis TaxID=329112 RepID=UPI002479B13C|nr:WD repeat-containing protein 91 [Toxorhynchites rutilus septentrionalis]
MAHIQYTDGLVREYVLFRGFSNTLKSFDAELKNDKDKSFRVDKIIDQLMQLIQAHDLQGLRDLWAHLNNHLFRNLEHSFTTAVNKLEQSIFKFYLVIAYMSNKPEKVNEFFTKLASELVSQSEWKEWFFFPFCKNPEEHSAFAVCFTKQWQDTLLISLHNFLSTIYQCMPQPTISKVDAESNLLRKLQEENAQLRAKLQSIQQHTAPTATSSSHQSRVSSFHEQKYTLDGKTRYSSRAAGNAQFLNDIIPFDIPPPPHIVDDFYIIAQETNNIGNAAESQARGLKSLIKNISSGGSPVLGRKDTTSDRNKKRSGSVGSRNNWIHS